MWSARINGSTRQGSSPTYWRKGLAAASRGRRIAFELLEDRRLLSAGTSVPATANLVGLAASLANPSAFVSNPAAATTSTGPVIDHVVVSQSQGRMSWNVSGSTPVATTTLQIDGVAVGAINGPYTDLAGGVNFSAATGTLSTGLHTYTITATDTAGVTSTATNTFTTNEVTATSMPVISSIVVSQAAGRATWNVLDTTAIAYSTMAIDGVSIPFVSGPYSATSGVNFSGPLTILSAGSHALTITATNTANVTATTVYPFTITPTGPGPVISSVVVTGSTATVTWNAADASGVTGSTLKIDGVSITPTGPIGSPVSADYTASMGLLNAGCHTVVITATNTLGQIATLSANFILDSQSSVGPTIGSVAVSESRARMSWNAIDTHGVNSSMLSIDGTQVSGVIGPFTAASGVNFSAPLDSLEAGLHTYTITAFDGIGSKSTLSGTITLAATTTYDPMIRLVTIAQSRGRISWNVLSPNTIVATTLQIDGVNVSNVIGPFVAASGVNFSGPLGSLVAGSHMYRITATDNLGRQSTVLANFNIDAASASASSAMREAVFSDLGNSTLPNSAKADWLLDV